ncbi:MAG: D-amino acid dehydrogenase, partial [Pseudomonadota bacterium]
AVRKSCHAAQKRAMTGIARPADCRSDDEAEAIEEAMRVLVLGGGVIGITTAWFLAQDGHDVTVVEREPGVALATSYANGSMIHSCLVEPWNEPGIALKLIKWLGRNDAPAVLRLGAIPGMFGWGLAFLRNATTERHQQHTLVNLRLALLSADLLRQVRNETGIEHDQRERGILKVLRSQAALDASARHASTLAEHGTVRFEVLDREGVFALEPALVEGGDGIAGGVVFPDDESGDCHLFTRRLAQAFERKGGRLKLRTAITDIETEGDEVTGVVTSGGRLDADAYVLAAGWDSPALGHGIGLQLPINPVKGYSITVGKGGWNDSPQIAMVDETLKVGVVPLGDRLRIAGSAEFTGPDLSLNPRRSDYVWETALKVYPAIARYADMAKMERWTGLRPMTPDGPPIIGPTRLRNLYLNAGHGHLGWTFACGSAQIVAATIAGRKPPIALDGLTFDRFG